MKIAWLQYDIKWKDSSSNLSYIRDAVKRTKLVPDLLVLPEMFDTGFVLDPRDLGERDQNVILKEMQDLSEANNMDIAFSMIWQESGTYRNRAFYLSGNNTICIV